MGTFPIFAHYNCQNLSLEACDFQKFKRPVNYTSGSVEASPGYFALHLESGIRAEMTATEHAALYRFTFLGNETTDLSPLITLDGSDLTRSSGQRSLYVNETTGRMTANGVFSPSFGRGTYRSYVCVDFQGVQIRDTGGFDDADVYLELGEAGMDSSYAGDSQGVFARFQDVNQNDTILARVGLSWLNQDRACENAEREMDDFGFDRLRKEAEDRWRKKFEPIQISHDGVDETVLRNFWSGVYRAFLSPQDYTGENQLWKSTEPYYDSWYCIWDTFRGVHPFFTLVDTVSQSRMVRSLIDIYKNEGYLPDVSFLFAGSLAL